MDKWRKWRHAATFSILLAAFGCSTSVNEPTEVHGKVLYKEQPLRNGTIVFAPDNRHGATGPLMAAEIRPDGSYELTGTTTGGGVRAGWYRVTVVAVEPTLPQPGGRFSVPRSLVPEKYRDPDLSGLGCQIAAGKKNRIDFRLE